MQRHVLIFHGTGGHPKENWFPWLKEKLEDEGYKVEVPQLPTPENQSLESWLKVLKKYQKYINQDTVIIGHSLGGLFLLRVLERLDSPIKTAFFVAAPVGILPIQNYAGDDAFSPGFSFDWRKIKSNAAHFKVFHSDNDPYISLENGEELARHLGGEFNFIPDAGHLNAESGYTRFPLLLEKMLSK